MRGVVVVAIVVAVAGAARAEGHVKDGVLPRAVVAAEGGETLPLHGTWRATFAGDPLAADPGAAFDIAPFVNDVVDVDAGWLRVEVPRGLGLYKDATGAQPYLGRAGIYWYRLVVELPPPAQRPVAYALGLGELDSSAEIYADGRLVGARGVLPTRSDPHGVLANNMVGSFAIPVDVDADHVVIAIRVWRAPTRADSNPGRGGLTHPPILFGEARAVTTAMLLAKIDRLAVGIVFAVAGLYHLHLWRRRRELRSYFWFGLSALSMSTYMFAGHHWFHFLVPDSTISTKTAFCSLFLGFPFFIQFLWPFLGVPIRWWWRVVQAISLAFFVVTALWPTAWFVSKYALWWASLVALPEMVGMFVMVARLAWRGDPEARTILVGAGAILATTINNVALDANLWRAPELTNVAFMIFVLTMAASQANRFARLYKEVDDKNAELVRVDKLKDEFLANTSHELRTPLNGILGIAEGLIDGAAGPQSEKSRENLLMILTSGQRLSSLINDILDFSKLREGKMAMQRVALDLHPAADVVIRLLTPLAQQKGLRLENRVPRDLPPVLADESRLQQIMTNLVGNAIKFTEAGSVVVDGGVDDDGAVAWFAVQDTGPGIAKENHARIFNAFEQGDGSTARSHGGTGLGLSITRRLVELHGGSIHLASQLGQGARFTVRLPVATDAAREAVLADGGETVRPRAPALLSSTATVPLAAVTPATEAPATSAAPAKALVPARRYRVLVVDDEPINVRVLENHLGTANFDVLRASDGPSALKLLEDGERPDLVLLDVMMPKMSGYEVCQHIRQRFLASEVPVVLVTAKDRVHDVVTGFDAGANDYLTKPVAKGELLARIKTHLQVAKMNEATQRFVPFEFLAMLGKESLLDVENGDQVQKDMSVLFSDIRSFTTIVEKNTPQENIAFINGYLARMEPPITEHAGFVDSFIGDAIMALFDGETAHAPGQAAARAPRGHGAGGAIDAVDAGIAMQRALPAYNAQRAARGEPPVHIGIGVMTGLITCGTIGGRHHIKCGVIGDAVNTASRIEGMTKMYGAGFLIGDATAARLPADRYTLRPVDRVRAKGKTKPITIYEVVDALADDARARRTAALPRFLAALELFYAGRFDDAHAAFAALVAEDAHDVVAGLYVARAAQLKEAPPPAGWDGVVDLVSK